MKWAYQMHLLKLREREASKLEELISGLYIDWKNGDITREQYRKMKEKFERQEVKLKENIGHIRKEIGIMSEDPTFCNPYLQTFLEHKNIQELSQGILAELVNCILIHENGGITIQFKMENQYKCIFNRTI